MTLYFIIFGNLIGRRVGEMGGFDYMQFMAPGLIMMAVITNSYGNVVSSFFAAKFQGHLQEMLVAPIRSYVIILGHVAGGVIRGLLVGAVVTIVALFFTDLEIKHPFITISMLVLTATVFSLGGMINAIFARKFDDVSIIPSFVLAPLTYLGGVFYTTSLLPDFWAKVSALNPILYMVNGFRYGMLGVSDINIVTAYVVVLVFVALAFGTCFYLISKGVGIRE
jgi:ABC-2 type transport system permease protein